MGNKGSLYFFLNRIREYVNLGLNTFFPRSIILSRNFNFLILLIFWLIHSTYINYLSIMLPFNNCNHTNITELILFYLALKAYSKQV